MEIRLHHVNVNSYDVAKSVSFYKDIVGFDAGEHRPAFTDKDGAYIQESYWFGEKRRGLHLCMPNPDVTLRRRFSINPTVGGHAAFTVPDISALRKRLDAANIMYTDAGDWASIGLKQIYVMDPSGNVIEFHELI
ncbi:VOC family protein [Propylenella binzhouense]|uniref:VOC domain-containing protein n=1 Tax=Propylenella binzhouense TaxID=2555902 RepID=A0A964WSC9_9HYPH|nr:hypothetical protein [Propylenella binzhouense]